MIDVKRTPRATAIGQSLLILGTALLLGACPDDTASPDAAVPTPDAAADAAIDATVEPPDAMADAAPDAAVSCDEPIACPAPAAGKTTLCGRVFDVGTTAALLPETLAYRVAAYDALAFAAGQGPAPLLLVEPDACGRFALVDVSVPQAGFIAVVVDDPAGADDLVATAVALAGTAGNKVTGLNAFATRSSSEAAWTASAGLGGTSFAALGVYLPIFIDSTQPPVPPFAGSPAAGVTVTASGSTVPANDHYFSDTDVLVRATVAPAQSATGPNGSALFVNGELVNYSGTGAEPEGCSWPTTLAFSMPGTVFVQERPLACN